MKEVYEFLKECWVYYLATIDNNEPRVRPFGTVDIYENHLYIQTGKNKDVFKQIEKNNKVEICGFNLGRYVEDGYVEVFENIYEDILPNNPYNYIDRCPYCGQLLDWKYKSRLEEDWYMEKKSCTYTHEVTKEVEYFILREDVTRLNEQFAKAMKNLDLNEQTYKTMIKELSLF